MFYLTKRSYYLIALIVLTTPFEWLSGQASNTDPGSLYQESMMHFEEGDYRLALAGFLDLKDHLPGDAMNGYYAGRCLVELNENLADAIEWLYMASKKQVPKDVNLYLGMAYQRDYNFSEAIKYFGRYELKASKQEVKKSKVKHLISTCRSALEIIGTYNQYEVMTVTFIDLADSVQFSQIRMKGGQLQRKPSIYFKVDESKDGISSLMFMPANPLRGDYAFFSGYDRAGKEGAQLFRVKKGTGNAWGDPVPVKDLNTTGDEILPYYDPIENDLYFASDGRRGIGGFDLYRAHYDEERDEWTQPINLGFPINSVMDEYLLLPGSDLGMVMFFSNRQGTDSTATVYRVHLVEPKKKADVHNNKMLKEIASLGGAASEILAELESISSTPDAVASGQLEEMPEPMDRKSEPKITRVKILDQEEVQAAEMSEYQLILAGALKHQAASDSLKDLATSARLKVRESDDPNDRWVWQKQIMVWEKKASDEEAIADELYATMEGKREASANQSKPVVNVPETIEVDTVMDDLTVYRYKKQQSGIEGEPGTQPAAKTGISPAEAGKTNRFDILGSSPYSQAHPIPVDGTLPGGVFYRIQLGAYGQPVEPDNFQGISPITAETLPDRGLIKYYAGKFSKYKDATAALEMIRSRGYEDAFVVAWYNGSPVTTQKAKQLE